MNLHLKLLVDYYVGGAIHAILKPFVILLGKILKRNHSLEGVREVAIIKLLGGGSIIIAYPSLLALKDKHPGLKLTFVTSPAVAPFAEMTGLFDEIIVIRDSGLLVLLLDSIKAIRKLWRIRVLIDLEIHSRLSSVFTLVTCAVNRIGVYTDLSFWRRSIYTHLLFYNKFSAVYYMYDHVVRLLGVETIDLPRAKAEFGKQIRRGTLPAISPGRYSVGIAPGCSDLGGERVLTADQWIALLGVRLAKQENLAFYFIGGKRDSEASRKIMAGLVKILPTSEFHDCCGKYPLLDSVKLISQLDILYCIDSSPVHFARLLGVKSVSFWGPTGPEMRLRPDPQLQEETHYVKMSCSPCVHVAFYPPCRGNNICMKAAVEGENYQGERNPMWVTE
jgi:ADP-heptose:LPS heptosyltransferase